MPENAVIPSFADFLATLEGGALENELTGRLRELSEAMQVIYAEHGGQPKGRIDLSFEFELKGGMVHVAPALKVKLPSAPRESTSFFVTADHQLTRSNPKQPDMFRDVNADKGTVKKL